MSDTMLLGVLRMPPDLWADGPIDQQQRHERYLQAADKIEQLRAEVERLRALLNEAAEWQQYDYEDSECGYRHCCMTASYKPHVADCKFNNALRGEGE